MPRSPQLHALVFRGLGGAGEKAEGATAVRLAAPSKLSRKVSYPSDSIWRRNPPLGEARLPDGTERASSFPVQFRGATRG
jgi:hypothetical protein